MTQFSLSIVLVLLFTMNCYGQDSVRSDEQLIFIDSEIPPSFPGGEKLLRQFVNKNLKYPKRGCVEGTAFVSFVVNEDGSLSEIKIVRGVCDECDKNAIEVLKIMPKWIPGRIDGKVTQMRMIYSVKFSLS